MSVPHPINRQSVRPIVAVSILALFSLLLTLSALAPIGDGKDLTLAVIGSLALIACTVIIIRKTDRLLKESRIVLRLEIAELEQQNRKVTSRFEAITEQSTDGITVADVDGNYTFVNPTFCRMMGYSEDELLSMTVFDVKAPEQDHSSFERTKTTNEGEPFEVLLQRKDGSTFISEVVGKNITINGEHQVLGTVRDISEQVKAEERTRTLYQAVEQSPVSVIIFAADGRIQYVNSTFEEKTGFKMDQLLKERIDFIFPKQLEAIPLDALMQLLNEGKSWEGEIQTRTASGDTIWEYAHLSPVKDVYGKIIHYIAVKEDISLRKEHEEKIVQQAHFDALTKLPNRFLSLDRLSHTINDAKRIEQKAALLFIDLDDFKKVNDTLGHEVGDKLLIEAASRLSSTVRAGDTVGRLGGDEFIVILNRLDHPKNARLIAENLIDRFRDPFKVDSRELLLTASVGIAIFPSDGENTSDLLRNSDSAMYHAKEQGRNTYAFFTDDMNREVSRRLALEEQIHNALKHQEFKVVYQPIVNVHDRKIIGAEALLRWHNDVLGDVTPEEFIPIAEQTGLIVPVGEYVLTEALRSAAMWQQQFDPDFRIAINLSPRQFRDPELVSVIQNAMAKSSVSNATLELEITEGVLLSGHSHVQDALSALNKMNVNIAMDDFGTGYSSLSYLRNYPFDVMKIDRSFVHDISTDPSDKQLIKAAVAMAHGLQLKVVVEGVETEEQLQFLSELDCDYAQGYLFGQPLNEQDMTSLLAAR